MDWLDGIRGALFDVEGTLLRADRPIPGAADCLRRMREAGIAFRLVTNTTRRSRRSIAAVLGEAGIEVSDDEVLAPAVLARRRVLDDPGSTAALLVAESTREDLQGVPVDEQDPDWVVFGDMGREIDWETINRAFVWVMSGAKLIALHKNPWWSPDGVIPQIDAGAFVAGLEYSTGIDAEVVGKPSPRFFELALEDLGAAASDVLVVGDNLANDGVGGAQAGCRTALVRTGIFRDTDLDDSSFRPDLLIDSVAALAPRS